MSLVDASTTTKTVKSRNKLFVEWTDFCQHLGKAPSLCDVPGQENKLAYLLVFGLRFRETGQTGKSVRADTVENALLAVGQGITELGQPDPRKEAPGAQRNHPLLSAFLKSLRDQDDPQTRTHPANVTILRGLYTALDTEHPIHGQANKHAIDLAIVAFFWLLRPAEYLKSTGEGRSQAFRFCDITLTANGKVYQAPDPSLNDVHDADLTHAALMFTDQKNAVRGEQVGHRATSDDDLCPAKALARLARHLREHNAPQETPICTYWDDNNVKRSADSKLITNGLRHAANSVKHLTGIPGDLISARSLRPGGATALLCAGTDKDVIQLLGRWKSDAMLRYLRIQAHTQSDNFAQKMLDHGAYTFAPGTCTTAQAQPVPLEAPAAFVELLHHSELFEED